MTLMSKTDLPDSLKMTAFVNFITLGTALAVGFCVLFVVIGASNSLSGALFYLAAVVAGWYLIYKSAFKLAVLVVSLSLLLSTFWFVAFSGGSHSPFLIWLACPPLILGLLVNWRWSLIAGALVLVFSIGLKIADHQVVHMSEFQVTHEMGMDHTIAFVSVISAVATVIFFSFQNYRTLLAALQDSQLKERTDSLTGILNRGGFNQVVAALSEGKSGDAGALIMFDVDGFKLINDEHGHLFGDYVLQSIASEVSGIIRENDAFARIGGDEFSVILPNSPHKHAATVGKRIKDAIDAFPFKAPDGAPVRVAVSVGVATCEDADLCQAEPMMHLADTALYEAKAIAERVTVKRLEEALIDAK